MILTSLENADIYGAIHPRLAQGIAYLKSGDWQGKGAGTYVLEEGNLSAMIQDYDTIGPDDAKYEAHRVYTDIQFVVSGAEGIGVGVLQDFTTAVEYDAKKDIAFYEGDGDVVTVKAGMLAILFPHDAHKPRLRLGDSAHVEKIVLKVRVD